MLALNTLEQYLQQYFKKWGGGQWGKILMMRIKIGWSSVRGAGTLSFMGGLIFRG